MSQEIQLLTDKAKEYSKKLESLQNEVSKVIVGQDEIIIKKIK